MVRVRDEVITLCNRRNSQLTQADVVGEVGPLVRVAWYR